MTSGRVRPFLMEDIPPVADLYTRVFLRSDRPASQKLTNYFEEIFFGNPCCQEDMPSLVYQETHGRIVGFQGVLSRRMRFLDRRIRVAIAFHLMVEPQSRSTLASVQLLKTVFAGPQDLTLTDGAGIVGRQIWEALGGKSALLYSLYWTRVLRPAQLALSALKKRKSFAPVLLTPLCTMAEKLMKRAKPLRFTAPRNVVDEELDKQELLSDLGEFSNLRSLRPDYDERTLDWLLERLAQRRGFGQFRKVSVRSDKGLLLGWYMYYLNPGGTSEVIQFAAKKEWIGVLLNHLFFNAWREGAAAVSGRLDPRFMQELSDNYCIFHRRGPWLLVHANESEVLQDICLGHAFLTRLDGEWCALYDGT
jgi:hypothetical protein